MQLFVVAAALQGVDEDPGWYSGWAAAQNWGKAVAPHTEVIVLPGKHLLHWEAPDQVNAVLDKFLEKVKSSEIAPEPWANQFKPMYH